MSLWRITTILFLACCSFPALAQEAVVPSWALDELIAAENLEETPLCDRQVTAEDGSYKAPPPALLWRIHDPDGAYASYLMGTYHSGQPEVMAKAAKVEEILPEVDVVALELLQTDPAVRQRLQQQMRLPQGEDLPDLIGQELFTATVRALKPYAISAEVAMTYRPWALAITLNLPVEELQSDEVLDARIEQLGKQAGKRLLALESADEQMEFFLRLGLDEQKQILREAIRNQPKKDHWIQKLQQAYLAEDTASLMQIARALNEEAEDRELAERFTRALIDKRNRRMVRRMLPLIREGALLTAVGALHLPGEKGILHRLEKEGFCLETVN